MRDLAELGVACTFDVATKDEIESWINQTAATVDEVDPEIFEIFSKCVQVSRSKFETHFRKLRPDFRIDSEEGKKACITVLRRQIKKLHSQDITPFEFCRFIGNLENYYMDNGAKVEGKIAYPEFIGDLWNACDWCDESWTLDNSEYLNSESRRVAETLAKT